MKKRLLSRLNNDTFWVSLAILIGIFLRLDLLFSSNFAIDADEAIVGLMAKHILDGRGIPVFYYGQHYMGSLEAILVACNFYLFNHSQVALKIVPLFFSIALIPLMYLVAKAAYDNLAGRFAALFTAVSPIMLIIWSSKARGGFIEVIFIGALSFLLLMRWLRRPTLKLTCAIGLLLGLGWWVNNQIIYFMIPVALWMALRCGMNLSLWLATISAGLSSFLVGSLPFWIYNLRNDFITFEMFGSADSKGIATNVAGLFQTALPIILGVKRDWTLQESFPNAVCCGWILVGLVFLIVLCRRKKHLQALFTLKADFERPVELFLFFILVVLAVYSLSSFGSFAKEPRYLLPIYVGLTCLAGVAVSVLTYFNRLAGVLLAAAIVLLNLSSIYWGNADLPQEPEVFEGERVSKDHTDLIKFLDKENINFIRTDYWIGYRLAFETDERITFITFDNPTKNRIPEYADLDSKHESFIPLVLVPRQAKIVRQALKTLGYSYSEGEASGYVIIYNISNAFELTPVVITDLTVEASVNNDSAKFAIDGDINTRWGSAEPQKPLMTFTVTLPEPQNLQGLKYLFGSWEHDYPRALRIELEDSEGNRKVLLDPPSFAAIRYFGIKEYLFAFPLFPVKRIYFVQEGSDPVFDWSIAEIQFFK
ncbi:MAG: hypothetical protein ACOX2O_02175 [Bdellovibrionota bacterium]|jgi:4-amino-4-deoxy-L-arabinose transferase-like glycosyltransferase